MTPESQQYTPSSPPYNPMIPESPPYAPGSPAFNPTTPDESPPPPEMETMTGGGEREFEVGEIVYLRGGRKSNSPYNIIKKGDKFLTIESMDPSNYEDDAIQVVLPFELLKPEEFNASMQNDPFSRPLLSSSTLPPSREHAGPDGQGIVFAPVIKIVNGNDNSVNDDANEHRSATPTKDPFSVPMIRTIGGDSNQETTVVKSEVSAAESATKPAPVDSSKSSSFGGLLDFAKDFVIKKMG